jgi:membrane glycosyltransferase
MTDATLPFEQSPETAPPETAPDTAEDAAIAARRALFFGLNALSLLALALVMARLIEARGWSAASLTFLGLFLLGLPWTLMGFWNAVIGFVLIRLVADAAKFTNPALRATPPDSPIVTRTAICLAVRHEDVAAAFSRLAAMIDSILATPWASSFDFHVLSDSARPEIAAAEEALFAALQARYPRPDFLHYRRRVDNVGFKAGNLLEFAQRCVRCYDHMIVLDADSMMSAAAMLRLVRAMQANPTLGILQTLVVGKPSDSAFTRVFQFGMRHAMRMQTAGSAWWQGPAGPYWGHNAILRLRPFVEHCQLPTLPGRGPLGGQVLSHDQVEAALMRGAGYDVRVIADEFDSWEENPPTLPDFIKRDLRWCQGNLQYLKLLTMPGLKPMGRFQLVNAIIMYLGSPAGFLMLIAGLAMIGQRANGSFPTTLAFALYFLMLGIGFAPRALGMLDVLLRGESRHYGGATHLLAGGLLDTLFSIFLGPIMMVAQSLFVIGLAFGRRVIWETQNRDKRVVPVGEALRGLWPQLLFGIVIAAVLAILVPGTLPWAAPTILPCLLAVPFACFSASRLLGRIFVHARLCAIPDDVEPSPLLRSAIIQTGG